MGLTPVAKAERILQVIYSTPGPDLGRIWRQVKKGRRAMIRLTNFRSVAHYGLDSGRQSGENSAGYLFNARSRFRPYLETGEERETRYDPSDQLQICSALWA